jgi:succinyl-diaminopimelate desuccinylase
MVFFQRLIPRLVFLAAEGIPVLLSRPAVGNLHGEDGWIDIESMLDYFKICRKYVVQREVIKPCE